MECPQCNTENPEAARFCLNCGARMALTCPQCGADLPPQAKFCIACGAAVSAALPGPGAVPAKVPASTEPIAERLQRLVPREYAERLLATRGQVAPERRTVTMLFSDVKGSTAMAEHLDPEDVLEIMDGAFDLLIDPVTRHEGTLARLMGDAVLAFFGAPLAHEDDPERAVRAALQIVTGAQRYAERLEEERGLSGFNVRVGIHTGLVVVGEVGADLRVEYTAMGDAINLAARMEQAAPPGGILVTHDTYRHVRGVFDVVPQPPLLVKGRTEPVQTYLVQRAKERAFRKPTRGVEGVETRMVGREAELKHLQEAFHSALEDRELQVVTVTGDAGVGKSRLLYEFDLWAELQPEPFYYFQGRAGHEMQNLPYGLVRDLVSYRFEIADSDPPDVVRDKLEAGVARALGSGEGSRRCAHTLGHLLGFALGDSPHLAGAREDAQQFRDQALSALANYFRGLAAQAPVLILLDDLHWADDSSLDALNHLALALADQRLMIACTARPALFERRPHWGEGQRLHARLALKPLSRWDSRRLVAEILQKVPEVPQALRDLLVSGAEGNPFFLEELIRMLAEDGVIVPGEVRWGLEPSRLAEIRVPATLTGVLQARVDRLPPDERTVLQQASVVGRLFWDRAVARIHTSSGEGVEAGEVGDRLSALRAREMIYQRETSAFAGAQEYVFQHTLLREITYQGVLKRQRRAYHGLVADWLLEQTGERVGEYTLLIADHLALAGRSAKAIDYLLQAGDRARRLYAHQEAIHAYERALALLKETGNDDQAARTLMKLGLTYHAKSDFQRAREAYDQGFVLWQRAAKRRPAHRLPAPQALHSWQSEPATLEPGEVSDWPSGVVLEQLFSSLIRFGPDMEIVPEAATSWEVLEGGHTYVFHLRQDARWSDGTPVTARDFEYAWKRFLHPARPPSPARYYYNIRGAKAYHEGLVSDPDSVGVRSLDQFTLLVNLEAPDHNFLHLTMPAMPVPQHVVQVHGDAWTKPGRMVSNGPFQLTSWQRGQSLTLTRNPHYCGRFEGNLERVDLSFAPPEAAMDAYKAGRLDILNIATIPAADRDRLRHLHPGDHLSVPELATFHLRFDLSRPPFQDRRVRRAFALATDRHRLADLVLGGYLFPATGGLVPPAMAGHSPGIALPYDPPTARKLLDEAGYPGGRGFPPVELLSYQGRKAVHEDLQSQWLDDLGVQVAGGAIAWTSFLDRQAQKPPHIAIAGTSAIYPDPAGFVGPTQRDRHHPSYAWQHAAYEGLAEAFTQATAQAERLRWVQQLDQIVIEEAWMVPLWYGRRHLLVKPWVVRLPTSPILGCFWKDIIVEPHHES
jgi:ABC-type oligopeptide transport system substrate-binding subunit/class 3 adenylate cyclase/tetratricopeptide (TPR) repeat protein